MSMIPLIPPVSVPLRGIKGVELEVEGIWRCDLPPVSVPLRGIKGVELAMIEAEMAIDEAGFRPLAGN